MNRSMASWIAVFSAFISSGLALRVVFNLGIAEGIEGFSPDAFLAAQSRLAGVAALAALVSVIAQIIDKASK